MRLLHCIDNILIILFVCFCVLIANMEWHFFEPCTQKYTIETNNVDIASVVDSILNYNETSMTLYKDGISFSFSIDEIKDKTYIYNLEFVGGSVEYGDLYRGRCISEIMHIETCFENKVLSKVGKWEKHYLQGLSSFLAIKSIDYYLFKWFGYFVVVVLGYLLLKKKLSSS